jgi:c(7)-type cytochrome triheme protein
MSAVMHMLRLAGGGAGTTVSPSAADKGATPSPANKLSKQADGGSAKGRGIYQANCSACHATGAAGAPKLGDVAAWAPRLSGGLPALHGNALKGKGAMPAKGGNPSLAEADVKAAVDFMVAQARGVAVTAGAAGAPATAETKPETRKIAVAASADSRGRSVYQASCSACHATGLAGAPKVGDKTAWSSRTKTGADVLYASATKGKGAMPPKGGNASLPDEDLKAAVDFMLAQLGATSGAIAQSSGKQPDSPVATAVAGKPTEATPPKSLTGDATSGIAASSVNAFNRLMPAQAKRNLPPLEDGIHDVTNDGTSLLQAPLSAYAGLPKSNAGNRIDWVKSLNEKKVTPRADKQDESAEMAVLELNIVREVKGSMPDVVYPHKQHTQWLDCSNCHPAIFIPQKGANQISMASIILGQKCGVCHGKVAFPISECRLCHSKAKEPSVASAGGKP